MFYYKGYKSEPVKWRDAKGKIREARNIFYYTVPYFYCIQRSYRPTLIQFGRRLHKDTNTERQGLLGAIVKAAHCT